MVALAMRPDAFPDRQELQYHLAGHEVGGSAKRNGHAGGSHILSSVPFSAKGAGVTQIAGNGGRNDLSTDIQDIADKLWQAADKLRGTVDAAEYKHVVLGLLFLKY